TRYTAKHQIKRSKASCLMGGAVIDACHGLDHLRPLELLSRRQGAEHATQRPVEPLGPTIPHRIHTHTHTHKHTQTHINTHTETNTHHTHIPQHTHMHSMAAIITTKRIPVRHAVA